jgi:hypothetical protein
MTTPFETSESPSSLPPSEKPSRKLSIEHIVLGAVLIAVVLGAAGWFLLKPGSSSSAGKVATKPTATATAKPVVVATPPTPPAARAAFIAAGNKVCTKMNTASKALGSFPAKLPAQATFISKQIAITKHALAQLKKLKNPAADKVVLKKLYADVVHLDVLGAQAVKAMHSGNDKASKTLLVKIDAASNKANKAFTSYGLGVCGS